MLSNVVLDREPEPAVSIRLELPEGSTLERLSCSLCQAPIAIAIIPPVPPMPLEVRSLLRPLVRYVARKSETMKRAAELLLVGDIGGMFRALREGGAVQALMPIICDSCIVRSAQPRLLEARNGDQP